MVNDRSVPFLLLLLLPVWYKAFLISIIVWEMTLLRIELVLLRDWKSNLSLSCFVHVASWLFKFSLSTWNRLRNQTGLAVCYMCTKENQCRSVVSKRLCHSIRRLSSKWHCVFKVEILYFKYSKVAQCIWSCYQACSLEF